mmetsp:Transcript_20982/g.35197  ORF Transcript_20982/g.35197 Transcript_20982/m.35197 type:complete len:513 (-) Transcript_20982:204-1742(-)|eukprot:CAMPEP_0198214160 /NCGR_PEP_ID=MMETSP1445-20131203/38381_1 /TAXON_ID=36898 /ORGANISM="Pyramimonas sp., Strain CCMP2087" /LENGTH=512 /DNA_ID=CAMNT_0043889211 /DNA_START=84 /DNA_END=1622 /DNA_ORIENTATION=+
MQVLTRMSQPTARVANQQGPTKRSTRLAVNATPASQAPASSSAFLSGTSGFVTTNGTSSISRVQHRAASLSPRAALADAPVQAAAIAVEQLNFLTPAMAQKVAKDVGTPAYVYDRATLERQADETLTFPNAFGLTVRYAMKSSPNAAILQIFNKKGLHIDASSGYECIRAMEAGIPASHMSLSSQELPSFFAELVSKGVKINACSLNQLERYGMECPGTKVGLRFNPGMGSGGNTKTNVGGTSSSFGIWHELLPECQAIVAKYNLTVERIHTHIGSGSDPAVWQKVSGMSLDLCRQFPDVDTLNLGGGYKVGRMKHEKSTDLQLIGEPVVGEFQTFAKETGRKLRLEIEPGTFLLANSACIVSTIQDMVTTGEDGYTFLKMDTGMTELLRPSLYGSQHPLVVVQKHGNKVASTAEARYVVVGHCCESGDLISPEPDQPETLQQRPMGKAETGDLVVMEGAGAYCASMATKHYNSFPEAAEVMLDGTQLHLIRKRQEVHQIWQNEMPLPLGTL